MKRFLRRPRLPSIDVWVVILLFLLPPANAFAQDRQEDSGKSASIGLALALGNTVVPVGVGVPILTIWDHNQWVGAVLVGYGVMVGPFPGNMYSKDGGRGAIGMAIRGIAVVAVPLVVYAYGGDDGAPGNDGVVGGAIVVGVGATLGTIIWNTVTIPSAVRRHNEGLTVFPTLGLDGRVGVGFSVRW